MSPLFQDGMKQVAVGKTLLEIFGRKRVNRVRLGLRLGLRLGHGDLILQLPGRSTKAVPRKV
jgi:hypothetical protein